MRYHMVIAGLMAAAILLFVSISAVLARPGNAPWLQSTSESEPNNGFDEADQVAIPGYITGAAKNTPITETLDYFVMDTEGGRKYQASLTIESPDGLHLRMSLWNGDRQWMETSSSSSTSTEVSWTAATDSHYIRVEAVTVSTTTVKTANYRLDVFERAEPTDTPTPTSTPRPDPWDEYEPNDGFNEARTVEVAASITLEGLNFHPFEERTGPDEDWFAYYVKEGRWYQATTQALINVDTYMEIRNRDHNVVKASEDEGGGFASQAKWKASYTGYYYLRITNRIGTSGRYDTYNMTIEEVGTPATSTPVPGATPRGRADACEDNSTFERACVIPVNQSQTFNLVPPFKGTDNDFYKIWVKPGLHFRCATSDLSAGVDPNMIMFTAPSWDNAIGGNDDIEPGNYNSAMTYYATYSGWLYVLVGTGDRTPSDVYNSEYTLTCEVQVRGTSTPEPTRTPEPTHTPDGAGPTPTTPGSPVATPTPSQALTVRPMTTPTPAPEATPSPRFIPISLVVYYDGNNDLQPGAGEGIAGISAQAYEVATNQLLAQGFTDEQGNLEFTVAAQGPVRLSIPFLDFSQLVTGEGASIYLRIPPRVLPGGAP